MRWRTASLVVAGFLCANGSAPVWSDFDPFDGPPDFPQDDDPYTDDGPGGEGLVPGVEALSESR